MAGGEAESAVREMVRSMGAEQLDEAISFATMELAGRDIPFEDMFRLCDEQELRRAKKPAMAVVSGSGEEVERIKTQEQARDRRRRQPDLQLVGEDRGRVAPRAANRADDGSRRWRRARSARRSAA